MRDQKVGNFTVAFLDLTVPVSGIPIQVSRTYDSRDKRVGDFGVGWTLGVKALRARASGVHGEGWQQTRTGGIFPQYCVVPTKPHVLTITLAERDDGAVPAGDLAAVPADHPDHRSRT